MPKELERRLAAHTASPEDVAPWEKVKAQASVEFDDAFNRYEHRRLGLSSQEHP
jgi:hypothetical protein